MLFEPSQPPWIISGLKETFIKRYTVERTDEAEVRLSRLQSRVRRWRVVVRIDGMKYNSKGHKHRNRHKNRIKMGGQAQMVYIIHKL